MSFRFGCAGWDSDQQVLHAHELHKCPQAGMKLCILPHVRLIICSPLPPPQMRIVCKDLPAETLYDVLHDINYRKKWDSNMIETYDIGRLTVNADVGYYSCKSCSRLTLMLTSS